MSAHGDRPIARVVHSFNVPPEEVFDAWLDSDMVHRWMAGAVAESAGGDLQHVEIDARVGGQFTFIDVRNGEEAVHSGTYLEIDRPNRLIFTWLAEPREHSVVTIDFEATSDGCTLVLSHEMEPKWADYVEKTEAGWSTIIDHIARALE